MKSKKVTEEKTTENKKEITIPKAEAKLRQAIARVSKTTDGKIIFRHLMDICGFSSSSIVMDINTQEINSKSSIYMEARKTVYYSLRKMIPVEMLKEIEFTSIDEMED